MKKITFLILFAILISCSSCLDETTFISKPVVVLDSYVISNLSVNEIVNINLTVQLTYDDSFLYQIKDSIVNNTLYLTPFEAYHDGLRYGFSISPDPECVYYNHVFSETGTYYIRYFTGNGFELIDTLNVN